MAFISGGRKNVVVLAQTLADGFVQDEIERTYQAKVEAIRNGKVLVGVTKFRSDEGNGKKSNSQSTNGLLPDRRLAEEFE